jgi:hypothetical protein
MDPKELFRSDKLLEFWPTARQNAKDRVAATTRFIIYASCIIYLIKRDSRVFALGALVLAILYYLFISKMIPDGNVRPAYGDARQIGPFRGEVQMPSESNPMGNVLISDYTDKPDRPSAAWFPSVRGEVNAEWAKIHPFENQWDAQHNFYTTASTTIPNDQTGFAQAAYGKPFSPMCHDQGGSACNPDGPNFHFPEVTQMRGGAGR